MNKLIIVIIAITLSASKVFSQQTWLQKNQDKVLHATSGFVIGATSYHFIYKATGHKMKSRVASVLITAMAGGIKEYLDIKAGRGKNAADVRRDFAYTVGGGVLSLSITF